MTRLEPSELLLTTSYKPIAVTCGYCNDVLDMAYDITGLELDKLARSHRCTMKG